MIRQCVAFLFAVMTSIVLGACDSDPTGLTVADVVGIYILTTAEGSPLPYRWPGEGCSLTTESGTFAIFETPGGLAYNMEVNTQYYCSERERGLWLKHWGGGSVRIDGDSIYLRPAGGEVWSPASVSDDTVVIPHDAPTPDFTFVRALIEF